MDFSRATITVGADGLKHITADASATLGAVAAGVITTPFSAFSAESEHKLITKREAGFQALTTLAVGFLGGEWLGHKRAAAGSSPIVSFG